MKNFRFILTAFLSMILSLNLLSGQDGDVQYIAIHFGDPANAEVIDQSAFPSFSFYVAPGEAIGYTEAQKLIGNPTYLKGWYGEVPEKMGFCANYRGEMTKATGFPYRLGSVYILDKNGVVAYQLPPKYIYPEDMDGYSAVSNDIKGTIKKMAKGKEMKAAKKQEYIKTSSIGELESTKGSKIDTKGEGILGWNVPALTLKDMDGNEVKLDELAKGKATVLVVYTLNGVTWKKGDTEGNIISEVKGDKLINGSGYADSQGEEFNKKAEAGDLRGMAKMALSEAGASDNSFGMIMGNESPSNREKAGAYNLFLQHLIMVQDIIK
ncbi:hypothetical protein ACFLT1_03585 [Bacteroidota bacterium]